MTRTLAVAVSLLALLAAAPAASAAPADIPVEKCGRIPFTPNSDDLATTIRARGVTCAYARDFVRRSEGRPSRRHRGFTCTSRRVDGSGLSYRAYRCTYSDLLIRWKRF